MVFDDKLLTCCTCNEEFLFSAGEQEFFSTKGLINVPKRCPNCRLLLKVQRSGKDVKHIAQVNCAECNTPTKVPFQPKGYRPVYCSYCFQNKKRQDPNCQTTNADKTELEEIIGV
jgi:CxxC-x17-CxxC domain-containing protein